MKLFWRIFLSFWLSTILMIAAVLATSEILSLTSPEDLDKPTGREPTALVLTNAVNAYEQEGAAAFLSDVTTRHSAVLLFDQNGKVLVESGATRPFYARVARDALQSNHIEVRRAGFRRLFVFPIQSATGRQYAAIVTVFEPLNRLAKPRFWLNLAIAMLPAALVCLVLSLYLTRPITRLRATAKRLAAGDFNARSSPHRSLRRDELGDLARDFDAMAAQIQTLITAQRRFVADVSHELGAPLTRMHLALALLRRRFAGENSRELERIERETGKLNNLVQQLLLLARMEAGARPAETWAPVSMQSLCESVIEDAAFEAAQANCVIRGVRQEITLLAYPQLLRRAIDNVLRNAIRYAPEESEILLNCCAREDLKRVVVEVADSGPGVPDAMLSDIFLPFFRTAPGRESGSGGSGLGLSIAAEAVRLHKGTIRARNRRRGGLRVTITLPLIAPTPEHELQISASSPVESA
jgi:two-component system, OmpR family, sensor histidine kinase CpxA